MCRAINPIRLCFFARSDGFCEIKFARSNKCVGYKSRKIWSGRTPKASLND